MSELTASVTKILDLLITEVDQNFINQISGFESYDDRNFPSESLYSPYDLKEMCDEGDLTISDDHLALLDQIFDLCAKKDCAYFRVIH